MSLRGCCEPESQAPAKPAKPFRWTDFFSCYTCCDGTDHHEVKEPASLVKAFQFDEDVPHVQLTEHPDVKMEGIAKYSEAAAKYSGLQMSKPGSLAQQSPQCGPPSQQPWQHAPQAQQSLLFSLPVLHSAQGWSQVQQSTQGTPLLQQSPQRWSQAQRSPAHQFSQYSQAQQAMQDASPARQCSRHTSESQLSQPIQGEIVPLDPNWNPFLPDEGMCTPERHLERQHSSFKIKKPAARETSAASVAPAFVATAEVPLTANVASSELSVSDAMNFLGAIGDNDGHMIPQALALLNDHANNINVCSQVLLVCEDLTSVLNQRHEENRRLMMEQSQVEGVFKIMEKHHDAAELQSGACRVIRNLALSEPYCLTLYKLGCVNAIAVAMRQHSHNGDVLSKGCNALICLVTFASSLRPIIREQCGFLALLTTQHQDFLVRMRGQHLKDNLDES